MDACRPKRACGRGATGCRFYGRHGGTRRPILRGNRCRQNRVGGRGRLGALVKMNSICSPQDKVLLKLLGRVRVIRPEMAVKYRGLETTPDAMRKRIERLAQKGYLATSELPSGRHIA